MKKTPVITLRNIPHSKAVENHIKEKIDKLQHYDASIISCHVILEFENKNQMRGNLYETHITVKVPNHEMVATHTGTENMYESIQKAFDKITRQIDSYTEQLKEHDDTKHIEIPLSGKIVRMNDGDFGFIETDDGNEFYFNFSHVIAHRAQKLEVGSKVHFIAIETEQGPEAKRVKATD